jgi:transposase-like protein
MVHILAGILSLLQYKDQYHANQIARLSHCLECGRAKPWYHGYYPRKSDHTHSLNESLNPIFIQRYYCPGCGKTCSELPECIPARRWYLWETQQAAILLFLLGKGARSVEKQVKPSRHTIKRWAVWLLTQFTLYKDTLCRHYPTFGLLTEPVCFWRHVKDFTGRDAHFLS